MNRTAPGAERRPRAQRRRARAEPKSRVAPLTDGNWFWIIFACAFFVRLLYLIEIDSIPLFYHLAGDGRAYDEWGQRIAAGDWLGQGVFYQAPLYPYFLGFLQVILGHHLWLIRLVQIALGAISCALIFATGRNLFSRQAGIAAGLILSFYAPAIFFDGLIEKSNLDFFLLSLFLWLLTEAEAKQQWKLWLVSGVMLGLLGLSRENALILGAVVPIWIGIHFSQSRLMRRLDWIGLFFAGLLVVLLPVGLRNLAVGGEFKLTTSQLGPNFFIGNNPTADGTYVSVGKAIGEPQLEGKDAKRLAERALGRSLSAGEVSDYWLGQSWDYIRSQTGHWLALLGKKWLLVWNAREIEDSDDFYIYQQWSWLLSFLGWINHFGVLVPLAFMGIFLTAKKWRQLWLLYAMILSLATSVAIFYVFGRYRFPLVPFLGLFAGAGIAAAMMLYEKSSFRPLITAAMIALSTGLIVNWPLMSFRGPGPSGYNNLANAFSKEGKIDRAIETAKLAIAIEPDHGIAQFNLGNLYAAVGKLDLAKPRFEATLRPYPNYAEAHSNLGQLLAQQGDIEGGIREFRRAIELNPYLSAPYLNLGIALARQGRIEEAVHELQDATRMAPESAEAYFALGSLYASQGRYDDAAKAFNETLRVQGDFAAAHQSLAQLLALQGKKVEAVQHYQEAIRLMKKGSGAHSR